LSKHDTTGLQTAHRLEEQPLSTTQLRTHFMMERNHSSAMIFCLKRTLLEY
jgi:hypothetical protein